ncbi:HD domain-containing protein [Orenia metallireducens]|uniref:HD domain-containing protein n=1 Tax=Orenia metallireducens TaxID=1413210 RepID=A0A285FE09_9FIRM|nr:HD domain-containing protein [Orenia metallireducens]PRX33495.1 HD domain-containing protein [Orenia metallireducens]SNY09552.1 HD domain-containing protein [Orenia metallireducens]
MNVELNVPLFDMVMCLSDAMDLVSPIVTGHHKRVAYIASSIGRELELSKEEEKDLIIAGALHDAGAFSLNERMDSVNWNISDEVYEETEFFTTGPFYEYVGTISHAELGYHLIKKFNPFVKIAEIIRYHHVPWENGEGKCFKGEKVPLGSHIIHLADAIDILINKETSEEDILSQSKVISKKILQEVGHNFSLELVEAFLSLAEREAFWFDIVSSAIDRTLSKRVEGVNLELNYEGLLSLANLFSQIIDFRNRFTATHSSGVAASAEVLANLVGLPEFKCRQIKIAGYLHDLGKLAVPPEILNKGGKLTRKEFDIIKRHPFYTYKILDRVKGLEEIKIWESYHHERVDGHGYPFHTKDKKLPIEARIMAVADVFTALTEDRPYRKGMSLEKALSILEEMSTGGALDTEVVSILKENSEEIDQFRVKAQTSKAAEYESFWQEID